MINRFSTPPIEAGKPSGTGNNTLLYIAGALILGYVVYRFVLKPRMQETTVVYEDAEYTNE
jgi:hypothetical protein